LYPALRSGFDTFLTTYNSLFRYLIASKLLFCVLLMEENDGYDREVDGDGEDEDGEALKLSLLPTFQRCETSPRSVSRSLELRFNIKQMAARLCDCVTSYVQGEASSLKPGALSLFCNSTCWMYQRAALVHGALLACEHRGMSSPWDVLLDLSPSLRHSATGIVTWAWKCCDEYKCYGQKYGDQNPTHNMR
jgi:hypothetical protein